MQMTPKGVNRVILRKKFGRLELLISPISGEPPFKFPASLHAVWNQTRSLFSVPPENKRHLLRIVSRLGLRRSRGIIIPPPGSVGLLSFVNLIEAHVLSSIRRRYQVSSGRRESVWPVRGQRSLRTGIE